MWLHLPLTCSPCAADWGASTWDYDALSAMLARFATWSGKSRAAKSWKRACVSNPLMQRRSTRTLPPSTAERGVESWIASLQESRAKETPSPANESSKRTRETSGPQLGESFAKWDRKSSCLKTSTASLFQEMEPLPPSFGFSESFPRTGSMRNGSFYRRPPLELRSDASGFFCWPAAVGAVSNDGESPETWQARADALKAKHINGNGAGTPLAIMVQQFHWPAMDANTATYSNGHHGFMNLREAADLWCNPMTPNGGRMGARTEEGREGQERHLEHQSATWAAPDATAGKRGMEMPEKSKNRSPGPPKVLNYEVAEWAAAAARDFKDGAASQQTMDKNSRPLNEQAEHWDSSRPALALDLPALWMMFLHLSKEEMVIAAIAFLRSLQSGRSGNASLKSDRTSPRPRLNPLFVEWLMGMPENWTSVATTNCGRLATA